MNDPKSPQPFPRDRSFMPGRPGGEAWDDDSVEGHTMGQSKLPKATEDEQDTEGHAVNPRAAEAADTEGHLRRPRAEEDDDTEGHVKNLR
jgi:hypothetical protein